MFRAIISIGAGVVLVAAVAGCTDTTKPTSPALTHVSAPETAVMELSGQSTICLMYRNQLKAAVTLLETSEAKMSVSEVADVKADEKELQEGVSDVCN